MPIASRSLTIPVLALAAALAGCSLAAPRQADVGPVPSGLDADTVSFASGSGATIRAWFAAGAPNGGAVLLLHGIHADRRRMIERVRFLHAAGYAILAPDLQANGESRGRHVTFGALESLDAEAALSYLRRRMPGERIGVIGVSMGGAAALVGPDGPLRADALVLESVYPTIRDAVRDRLRARFGIIGPPLTSLYLSMLSRETGVAPSALRPIDSIGRVGSPVFILAGSADRLTPPSETRALFASAPEPKALWIVDGAGHDDLHAFAPAEYERRVGCFLACTLRPENPHSMSMTRCMQASPGGQVSRDPAAPPAPR